MTFRSLVQTVFNSVQKLTYNKSVSINKINKVITECLLYNTLNEIINSNSQYANRSSGISDSYARTFKSIVENANERYTSYNKISYFITYNNINSILNLDAKNIQYIYNLFINRQEIPEFNENAFSPKMYGVFSADSLKEKRLKNVHEKVICPIVSFFKSAKNITNKDIMVENIIENNPGKQIEISIANVNSNEIVYNIKHKNIDISKYLVDETATINDEGNVLLLIK